VLARLWYPRDHPKWTTLDVHEDSRRLLRDKIARLIPPTSRVLDFGAWPPQLENLLDSSCTYVASDVVDRGPGTFVCDLNRRPLPDPSGLNVDTAVFCGVLERLHDLESLAEWVARHFGSCVASYSCVPSSASAPQRFRHRLARFYYGHESSYSEEEIVGFFKRAGFCCIARDPSKSGRLFLFANQRTRWKAAP
jgi:hypothetical protein